MSSLRLKIALAIALSAGFAHLGTVATVGKNLDVAVDSTWRSDGSSPEPLSVMNKLMEVETVGDVTAALSLFADDAIIVNVVGQAFAGQNLKLFVTQDIAAHDQFMIEAPQVRGDTVGWSKSITAGFYAALGVAPLRFVFEATVRSGKIKSIVAHLPAIEIARIETACRARTPEPMIYAQPCAEFVRQLKAHTRLTAREARAQEWLSDATARYRFSALRQLREIKPRGRDLNQSQRSSSDDARKMASLFLSNCLGCGAVLLIAAWKRSGHRRRSSGASRFLRRNTATDAPHAGNARMRQHECQTLCDHSDTSP